MVNENDTANERSPKEVWEDIDPETRESVINMFLHLAFKFVISQKTTSGEMHASEE